jgi:tight adherence protein C
MNLEQILTALGAYIASSEVVVYIMIFLASLLAVFGTFRLFAGPDAAARRMAGVSPEAVGPSAARRDSSAMAEFIKPLAKFVPGDDRNTTSLRQHLMQAGYFGRDAVTTYFGVRVFLAVVLPAAFLMVSPLIAPALKASGMVMWATGLGALGIYLPKVWVDRRVRLRQRAMQEGFPDALDMMVVCVEAGLGLDAAFARVAEQMSKPHPVVAQHFALVSTELRAGASRIDALRNMAKRVGLDDINSFVTVLVQSEQLGSSIAQTLRTYAYEMRQGRILRAEEKAHRLPVLLSIPLVLLILPCMVVAVILPGLITILRTVIPALSGG